MIGSFGGSLVCAVVGLLMASAAPARAQNIWQRLDLDKLRLEGFGAAVGPVSPSTIVSTQSYGVQADYGQIASHLRVGFSASFWSSRFDDKTVRRFITQLEQSLGDPADSIKFDRVNVSTISIEADLRYTPTNVRAAVQPYIGGGLGLHIVNAESKLIQNTFVESALDNIGAGISAIAGVAILPTHRVSVGVEARYTVLGTIRFGTLRAGAMFHFSRPNNPNVSTP
ncbi:MAG: outer membrane beta-barrel protein [Gemmatimonadaceae bacterium]|nr:outer membrane beta-barrel protein [Gemmatimonadaceae bacterium]